MSKFSKKLLSICLILTMIFGFAVSATAAESTTCGELLTWTLDSKGTLTVSGTGDMTDYFEEDVPWACDKIKSVVIEEGVDSIGAYAFSECVNLTKLTVADTVTMIKNGAFENCESLADITLPDSILMICNDVFLNTAYYNNEDNWENGVLYIGSCLIAANDDVPSKYNVKDGTTYIAEFAFAGNSGLTELTVPDSVVCIGCFAFHLCEYLESVKLGSGLKYLDMSAFEKCTALADVTIGDGLTYIGIDVVAETALWNDNDNWEDGVLYLGNHLVASDSSPNKPVPEKYAIKDGTKCIAEFALAGQEHLTQITVPASVTSVCESAFENCYSVKAIYFYNPETEIFDTSWTIPDSAVIYGYRGSTAENYASVFEREFVEIGNGSESGDKAIVVKSNDAIKLATDGKHILSAAGQTVADLLAATSKSLQVVDKDGAAVSGDKPLASGMKIILKDKNGKTLDEKTIAVLGDVDGNAQITAADARIALRASVELENLNGWELLAAKVNGNAQITAADARMILRASVGLETLGV